MGRRKSKRERTGANEQIREAEDQGIKEAIQAIPQDSTTTISNVSHSVTINSNEVSHDRPNSSIHYESGDRPEGAKKDTQVDDKDEQKTKESLQENISYLKDAIYPHWQAFLNALGNPRNWFLTKEDFEIVKAYFSQAEANINANIMEYLRRASDDPCSVHKALQFIVIRKLGTIQIQAHKNRIDAILQAIQYQSDMYKTVAQSLGQVVQSFSNSYVLQTGLSQFEIPNIIQDLKAVGIIGILTAALTAIGIEIGNLKQDLRTLIRFNEFCIRPCNPNCLDTPPLRTIVGMSEIADNHPKHEYNEGVEFGQESEVFLRLLEKVMQLETEYLEQQVKEGRVHLNKKARNNNNHG
jgi:hypothetical protein